MDSHMNVINRRGFLVRSGLALSAALLTPDVFPPARDSVLAKAKKLEQDGPQHYLDRVDNG